MNICLIIPPRLLKLFSLTQRPSPPLGVAFIAGALKAAGHKVTVIDAVGENPDQVIPFEKDVVSNGLSFEEIALRIPADTELIGLSLMFSGNWISNRLFIDFLDKNFKGIPVIAGGEHITAVPEFCMKQSPNLSVCVLGEGEETIIELINALETKDSLAAVSGIVFRDGQNIIKNTRRNRVKDIEKMPWPAWEYFPLDFYEKFGVSYGVAEGARSLPIMATRGCPYSCTFCSSPDMWGTRYYMRSPVDVANEIEYMTRDLRVSNFDFYDLTAIIKRDWIIDFAKEILNRGLKITWQIPAGTRSEAIDAEVARYLYLSGCRNITYAPESGSPEILKKIKKKVIPARMLESIRHSYLEKMNVKINIIIGFPDEKRKHLFETMWFLIKASWYGAHDMVPSIFSPYPGSELFNRLVKEGRIDMNKDDYFWEIIYVDTFFQSDFYNNHINKYSLQFYNIAFLLVFYASNYLFRPQRFFRTVRNLVTGRLESRAEMTLGEILKRNTTGKPATNKQPPLQKSVVYHTS